MMKKALLLTVGLSLATIAPLAGCALTGLTLRTVNVMNPSLNVGDSTEIYVDAVTLPFRTIRYEIVAKRGRIVRMTGYDNRFKYYAPFTSQAPNEQGNMESGDTLTIQVSDGSQSALNTQQINLTGSTMVMVTGGENTSTVPTNEQIVLAYVDSGGSTILNQKTLVDRLGNKVTGSSPVISPDGRRIAYVSLSGSGGSQIKTIDAARETSTITNSTSGFCLDPTWAPSAKELAYVWDKDGNFDLFRINIDQAGNSPTQVTHTKADERHPAWNPHSAKSNLIAICAKALNKEAVNLGNGDVWNLFVVDVTKGTYEYELTGLSIPKQFALEPAWKLDGESLAYTYYGPIQTGNSTATPYQRIFVQRYTDSRGSGVPLNPNEYTANVRESSPMWSSDNTSEVAYMATIVQNDVAKGAFGDLWKQVVTTGSTPERPLQWSQVTGVPTFWMDTTNIKPVGCRPASWR